MLLWIAAITTAAIGVFWLPWHCASIFPVPGESYAFGFNNKVGTLAFGTAIFLGIAASYGGGPPTEGYQWLSESPRFFLSWIMALAALLYLPSKLAPAKWRQWWVKKWKGTVEV